MKTHLFKHIKNFTTKKGKLSGKKKSDIFHMSTQNIDCGYPLEPLLQNKNNNVYPCKPQFYYISGVKGGQYEDIKYD